MHEVGDAEVAQARGSIGRHEHVLRFQIAMNDPQAMGAGQGVGQVQPYLQHALERQLRLLPQQVTE